MANKNTAKATKVEFLQFHKPTLPSGDYEVNITQKLAATGIAKGTSYHAKNTFSVLGDQYTFPPTLIHSVFPPAGSTGAYSNVLPHIILNRSTLPWERFSNSKKESPWLALLLFDQSELAPPASINEGISSILFKDYKQGGTGKIGWPKLHHLESGTNDQDRLVVLDIKQAYLKRALPSVVELNSLTHVRQATTEKDKLVGHELPVIISNRLPKPGSTSIIHLVSLEGRVDDNGAFIYPSTEDENYVRLVSLHHWKFSSLKKSHTFSGLLMQLNQQSLFNIPYDKTTAKNLTKGIISDNIKASFTNAGYPLSIPTIHNGIWDVFDRDYHYIIDANRKVYDSSGIYLFALDNQRLTTTTVKKTLLKKFKKHGRPLLSNAVIAKKPNDYWWIKDSTHQFFISTDQDQMEVTRINIDQKPTLRLPDTDNPTANKILENGYVPMPHQLRQGGRTVSWYRGPLSPAITAQEIATDCFPIHNSDELLRYDTNLGMLDVSYAAAWELGRLLCLKNKLLSVALWQWKRHYQQAVKRIEQGEQQPHLPISDLPLSTTQLPIPIEKWFSDLSLLKGIPFNYLVPDQQQLPKETIRYFSINPDWIASLIDGAFSIGRITQNDKDRDKMHYQQSAVLATPTDNYSGFIMRSSVVKGWSNLLVDGYYIDLLTELDKSNEIASKSKLEILRMDHLAKDTLLVIFKGDLKVLDIHLPPEILHFGVDIDPKSPSQYTKTFRGVDGNQVDNATTPVVIDGNRKVDIEALYTYARDTKVKKGKKGKKGSKPLLGFTHFSSAQFGLSMIEGVQKVRFIRTPKNT